MTFAVRTLQAPGGPPVALENINLLSTDRFTAYLAWAQFVVKTDGDIDTWEGNNGEPSGYTLDQTWLLSGSASDYSVRLTGTGSAPDSGSTATWLALTSSREWYWEVVGIGFKEFTGTLEIAKTSNLSNILASCSVTVNVETGPL